MPRLRTWSRSRLPHSGETWTQYVVQPTECLNQFLNWYLKTSRNKSGKLSGGRDLFVMKLKLGVSCHLPDVYTRFQVYTSKHVEKSSENFPVARNSAEIPLRSVCGHQGAINCPTMTKISTVQDTCYVSVYQIWRLYITVEWRRISLTHAGCKVLQDDYVWRCLLDVYNKFQIDISTHVQKIRKTFRWLRALLPLPIFYVRQRVKNCPTIPKIS